MQFDLKSAQEAANNNELETWIHAYLTMGYWANPGLSAGLKLQQRWWIGPVALPLNSVIRSCGPEPNMEFIVPKEQWEQRTRDIADGLDDITQLPPLIVQYHNGEYSLRDGNHRHEAMRLKGWKNCYVIIWFDHESEWRNSPFSL